MILKSSFSLNMLPEILSPMIIFNIFVSPLERGEASGIAFLAAGGDKLESDVGDADMAALFTDQLDVVIPVNRVNRSLKPGDELLVGQYSGSQLPEGAVSLPEGATIGWFLVKICLVNR